MKREKTVIDVEVSEEKQRAIVSSLLREHTNVGMKFERERTRQEEMVRSSSSSGTRTTKTLSLWQRYLKRLLPVFTLCVRAFCSIVKIYFTSF